MDAATMREGLPFPRGASSDGKGVNFALFSAWQLRRVCLQGGSRAHQIPRRDVSRVVADSHLREM